MSNKILMAFAMLLLLSACGQVSEPADTSNITNADTLTSSSDSLPPMDTVPAKAKIFFKNLKEGETVSSPLNVNFGINGVATDTVGVPKYASGHYHLLIDAGDSIPSKMIIANDSTHLHFDSAQTQTQIKLLAGKHKLALQYGDGLNRSYGEKLATSINIVVK